MSDGVKVRLSRGQWLAGLWLGLAVLLAELVGLFLVRFLSGQSLLAWSGDFSPLVASLIFIIPLSGFAFGFWLKRA
ncbi:MAG: hypothetical protein CMK09_15440 [Ponticaulis sp.]|nr:hypothetical protein [Ponticaulis sp.]|tara:strand:- start:12069 stop:12296 length:228 start_codon:yes stop_codon:yes gene_type:complete